MLQTEIPAFAHQYGFVTTPGAIHPFLDGNGSIGRLLMIDWELLPLPLFYLSTSFHRHRDTYYELLLAVSERGNWHEWILFFLRGVTEQADDAIGRARRLQDLAQSWQDRLQVDRADAQRDNPAFRKADFGAKWYRRNIRRHPPHCHGDPPKAGSAIDSDRNDRKATRAPIRCNRSFRHSAVILI